MITRRHMLGGAAALGGLAASGALVPGWAQSAQRHAAGLPALTGPVIDLDIARRRVTIDGRARSATAVNGTLPGPLLRWREGEEVTLNVTNTLPDDSSIHWHGILIPFHMDGVPGVSFPGIRPGETFTYRFPVRQSGTYWYHSHSGLQEQTGVLGPIVIDPAGPDPVQADREYVLVLSDWTDMDPHHLFGLLKKHGHDLNFQKRTIADFLDDAGQNGLGPTIQDRAMWGRMRMMATDIADVTGAQYEYLINGHGPADNWTAVFNPGERVRLRIINASAMTLFNLRIPGVPMTVVQADGLNVRPVETDEFQIGVAETYDVIVAPPADRAVTFVAESIDRSGMARATIAPEAGMTAEVPPLRPRPLLTMKDMGMDMSGMEMPGMEMGRTDMTAPAGGMAMDHSAMGHDMGAAPMPDAGMGHGAMAGSGMAMDHSAMGHDMSAAPMVAGGMDHGAMDHSAMGHDMASPDIAAPTAPGGMATQRHDHPGGPGVANTAMSPTSRLHEPGVGLEDVPHRALSYAQLRALDPNPDTRPPGREVEIHLTSNMERYMWSLDGVRFSEVTAPIVFHEGERLRMTLVNDTMMPHPIHLHGMFFDVVVPDYDGEPGGARHLPRKHTVVVKPGEKLSVDITADEVGDWAFHCHLLYHMHAGMMQVVSVLPAGHAAAMQTETGEDA